MAERRTHRWVGATLSIVVLCCGLALFSGRAWAVFIDVTETGSPGMLSLRANPGAMEFDLSPGSPAHVQIAVDLVGPSSPLTLQLTRDGELVTHPRGLLVQLQRCAQEWDDFPAAPTCASGAVAVLGPIAADDPSLGPLMPLGVPAPAGAPVFPGGTVSSTQSSYVLATLSLPDTPEARSDESLMGLQATIGLGFSASGDGPVPTNPPVAPPVSGGTPSLVNTGVDILAIALTAAGALGLGITLKATRRRSQDAL